MSRYEGWLVRFLITQGTAAAYSIRKAAKGAGIRPDGFAHALRQPKLVQEDAQFLGIDPYQMLALARWGRDYEAADDLEASRLHSSSKAVTRTPSSDKYRGSKTLLGVTCPNPGGSRDHRDELGLPINPIPHPEPEGEWHAGLSGAMPVPRRRSDWMLRAAYLDSNRAKAER